jgi:hypothetical protein
MLVAAVLVWAQAAHAADKPPVPGEAPPRVPFSAFRIKPILDMHSEADKPAAAPSKKEKPKAKDKIVRISPQKTPQKAAEDEAVKSAVKSPAPSVPPAKPEPEKQQAQTRERVPDSQPLQSAHKGDEDVPDVTSEGIPLPERKPESYAALPKQPNLFERILAQPSADAVARDTVTPPDAQAQDARAPDDKTPEQAEADADAGVEMPPSAQQRSAIRTDRIRDESRFNDNDDRTAGSGFGISRTRAFSVAGLGLPRDLRNLDLGGGPGRNGEISPVLLPGNTETVAAPDAPKVNAQGVPSDVVVFFQEASPRMEIGQIDVVNADVVAQMQQDPDLKLEIIGYSETLAQGADATRKMAEMRALELRNYLTDQHISRSRLTLTVKGDDTKVEPRDRVEMTFSR